MMTAQKDEMEEENGSGKGECISCAPWKWGLLSNVNSHFQKLGEWETYNFPFFGSISFIRPAQPSFGIM